LLMARDNDLGKCHQDEGSSRGDGPSLPHRMMATAGAHWVHATRW
jgi:hypothetical protein